MYDLRDLDSVLTAWIRRSRTRLQTFDNMLSDEGDEKFLEVSDVFTLNFENVTNELKYLQSKSLPLTLGHRLTVSRHPITPSTARC